MSRRRQEIIVIRSPAVPPFPILRVEHELEGKAGVSDLAWLRPHRRRDDLSNGVQESHLTTKSPISAGDAVLVS